MKTISSIIIHCSDSAWGCAREIREWHRARGFSDVGYQFVILNGRTEPDKFFSALNGSIEAGRDMDGPGAHCLGYNDTAIGICLIGKTTRDMSLEQFDAMKRLLLELCTVYKISAENVLGHCETKSGKEEGKTCPNFDVEPLRVWLRGRV